MSLDNLTIKDEAPVTSMTTTTQGGLPAPQSKLQSINNEFDGLGDSMFPARVILDGNQILYKDRELYKDSIEVVLTGGRKVHQQYLEDSEVYIKSYDGKFTTDGEPVSKYPGLRHMFEIDWVEEVDGEPKNHQLVLSPTSRYAFVEYAQKLAKLDPPKKVSEVTTIITVVRAQNKDLQRYSKAQFTCKELMG